MKKVIIILPFLLISCIDVDKAVDDATDECQKIVDEKVEDIWDQCTSYYEDEVIPNLEDKLSELVDDLIQEAEDLLENAEQEIFTRAGCFPDETELGWDCKSSEFCD